ncbi:MAG: hypothetical protein ACPG5U_10995 [Planktomarina sp.]
MTKDPNLDDFFAAVRTDAPQPSDNFMADMARLAVDHTPQVVVDVAVVDKPWSLFRLLGGWPAGAGMVMATVLGVMFGINLPDQLTDLDVAAVAVDGTWDGLGYAYDSLDTLLDEGMVQ